MFCAKPLEVQSETKLQLTWRAEREHARTSASSQRFTSRPRGSSIDAASIASGAYREGCLGVREKSELGSEVGQIEHVEGADRGLDIEALRQLDGPGQRGADLAEDAVAHCTARRRSNERLGCLQLLQL